MSVRADRNRDDVDVLVAGAGPAGSIAALELARAGFSVLLTDRLTSTGPRIGETLPGAAIRLLGQLDLPMIAQIGDETGHCRVGGSLTAWASATIVASDAVADPYGAGLRLDRSRFDAALRQASCEAGVSFHRANAAALQRGSEGWIVGLDDGQQVSASWLVDATGRRSKIARLIGARRTSDPALVAIYRFGVPERGAALDRTVIEACPDGWFYAGRLGDGRWAFGFHTSPEEASRLRREPKRWNAIVRQAPRLTELLGDPAFASNMVFRDARGRRLLSPRGDRWVACGDAAMSFDPIAGQGLFNALRFGMAAAQHVIAVDAGQAADEYPAEIAKVAAIYGERRRRLYGEQMRWSAGQFWRSQRDIPPASKASKAPTL